MKKTKLALVALGISTATFFSFTVMQSNGIKGSVTPADKAKRAWAINATDTIQAAIENGSFDLKSVKPGTYSVIIEAEAPFANTRKKDVVVAEGQTTDVGEIKLQPKN